MKITGIIPARYGSSRFPGKPLAMLNGRPMLFTVFEQASRSRLLAELFVATESPLIEEACRQEGIPVLMTSPEHENPTSRLCEAAKKTDSELHVMIGGDEPLLTGSDIDSTVRQALKLSRSPEPLFPGREDSGRGRPLRPVCSKRHGPRLFAGRGYGYHQYQGGMRRFRCGTLHLEISCPLPQGELKFHLQEICKYRRLHPGSPPLF